MEGHLKKGDKWLWCKLSDDTTLTCYENDSCKSVVHSIKTNEALMTLRDMELVFSVTNPKTNKSVDTVLRAANVLELNSWKKKIDTTMRTVADAKKAAEAMAKAQEEAAKALRHVDRVSGATAPVAHLTAPTLADARPPAATKPLHVQHGKPTEGATKVQEGFLKRVVSPTDLSKNASWTRVVLYSDAFLVEYEDEECTKQLGAVNLKESGYSMEEGVLLSFSALSSKLGRNVDLWFKAANNIEASEWNKKIKRVLSPDAGTMHAVGTAEPRARASSAANGAEIAAPMPSFKRAVLKKTNSSPRMPTGSLAEEGAPLVSVNHGKPEGHALHAAWLRRVSGGEGKPGGPAGRWTRCVVYSDPMLVEFEDEDATKQLGSVKLADAATKFKAVDMQLRVSCFSSKANKVVELVFKAEDAVQAQDFVKRMKKAFESGGGLLAPTTTAPFPAGGGARELAKLAQVVATYGAPTGERIHEGNLKKGGRWTPCALFSDGKLCEFDTNDALVSSIDLSDPIVRYGFSDDMLAVSGPKTHPSLVAMANGAGTGPLKKGLDTPITLEYTMPNALEANTWKRMIVAAVRTAQEAAANTPSGAAMQRGSSTDAVGSALVQLRNANEREAISANELEPKKELPSINSGWPTGGEVHSGPLKRGAGMGAPARHCVLFDDAMLCEYGDEGKTDLKSSVLLLPPTMLKLQGAVTIEVAAYSSKHGKTLTLEYTCNDNMEATLWLKKMRNAIRDAEMRLADEQAAAAKQRVSRLGGNLRHSERPASAPQASPGGPAVPSKPSVAAAASKAPVAGLAASARIIDVESGVANGDVLHAGWLKRVPLVANVGANSKVKASVAVKTAPGKTPSTRWSWVVVTSDAMWSEYACEDLATRLGSISLQTASHKILNEVLVFSLFSSKYNKQVELYFKAADNIEASVWLKQIKLAMAAH